MRCQQCDSDNPVASRFCAACGFRLEIACVRCGHSNPPASEFCGWCGATLHAASEQRGASGERKQATVLFADIVGSTHLIAGLDAEQAMGRLRPVLAAMAQAVRRFDGSIIRSLGDGLKASFGAPRAQEGHALLACKAALAMQEAVTALPSAPPIRIGLHSGEVVAGELDTGSAVEHETVGLTVHLANRIEQLAEPGGICLSGACQQLVRAYCDTAPLGPHTLKGVSEPVEIHRLIGLRPAVASEQFRGTELSPFLGRAVELALLQQAQAAAERGEAGVIGIAAPPGTGKSRLCYEFIEWCRRRHVGVLEARVQIYAQATPLQLVLEVLRSFLGVSPLAEAEVSRRQIAQRLLALDPAFESDLPLLSEFLGVGDPERPSGLESRAQHARLREIVRRMVEAAGRTPQVIVVEDLHWIDPASGDFVETLVDAVVGTHTLVVLNFRPAYTADWMARPHYRHVTLGELGASDIGGLVRDLVGDGPGVREIGARIADRSGGNPFFAEELVRSLAESGALLGERGRYGAGAAPDEASLPATVEAVIGARIDRLPEREKALLQVGATIGKEFPLVVLQSVAATPPSLVEARLARLVDAELIRPHATIGGRGFAFRHPLIQEVAYAMQLRTRRTALHEEVAKAIGRFEWGRLDEFAGLLAHHWEAAGHPAEAARHLYRTAAWVGRTSSGEAFRHWKRVRSLLNDAPRPPDDDQLRAIASSYVLTFGWREGMTAEEAKPYADEAFRYAREVDDKVQGPQLLAGYGRILATTGSADEYVALMQEALHRTAPDSGAGRIASLQGALTQAHSLAGILSEAKHASDAALATVTEARRLGNNAVLGLDVAPFSGFDIEHWIKCQRARLLVWLGRFTEAEGWIADVLRAEGSRSETAVVQYIPHLTLIEQAFMRDDAATAQRHAQRIAAYAEQSGVPYMRVLALGATGLAKTAAGDFAGARADLTSGIAFARRNKVGLEFEPRLMTDLSYAQYAAGHADEAAETARETIAAAQRRAHRIVECHASMVRAASLASSVGAAALAEIDDLLARAEHLRGVTDAALLDPLFARLRQRVETALQ